MRNHFLKIITKSFIYKSCEIHQKYSVEKNVNVRKTAELASVASLSSTNQNQEAVGITVATCSSGGEETAPDCR